MRFKYMGILLGCLPLCLVTASAGTIVYQDLPTSLSDPIEESHHAIGGPIIADDFDPALTVVLTQIDWWGSAAADPGFEIAFNTDDSLFHEPNVDNPATGAFQKFLPVTPLAVNDSSSGIPGLVHYTATFNPNSSIVLDAGTEYWITIANFASGWDWALATGGPTVGSELYNAHSSVGAAPCLDAGPHCGPWTDIHTDFAFQIAGVPEPATMILTGAALALLGISRRRAVRS